MSLRTPALQLCGPVRHLCAMSALVVCNLAAATQPEIVLQEDVKLTATTASGTVTVTTGKGLERTYGWNGCSFLSPVWARGSRWYGSLGVHGGSPGTGFLGSLLPGLVTCKGLDRTVVEEAQLHFTDRAHAERWVARYSKSFDTVWSNDGLVVQWIVSPERRQLSVDVWQLCIAGRKPESLSGAQDEAIQVVRTTGSGPDRHECAKVDKQVQLHSHALWNAHWKQSDNMRAHLEKLDARVRASQASAANAP